MTKNVIIDIDSGIDDILAVLIAKYTPEIQILGVSIVCGNESLEHNVANFKEVYNYFNFDFPVVKGWGKPLSKDDRTSKWLAVNFNFESEEKLSLLDIAVEDFYQKILSTHDDVKILCNAPLTNIANALLKYPALENKISEIIIMGGTLCQGNISEKAEFNFYHDPDAVKIVLESNCKKTLIPLEITSKIVVEKSFFKSLVTNDASLNEFYNVISQMIDSEEQIILHDILVSIYVNNPTLFTTENLKLDIFTTEERRGELLENHAMNEINIVKNLDVEMIKEIFRNILSRKNDEDNDEINKI